MNYQIIAREVLLAQEQALHLCSSCIDDSFDKAVSILLEAKQQIVLCALGKSGHIAKKIAATLNSTGSKALFLHPAEALHGDLGVCTKGDPTIMISKSGTSAEVVALLPILKGLGSKIIAITANLDSPLGKQADAVLTIGSSKEADHLGFVPTSSTTVSLVLGDALAIALMRARNFTAEDFAKYHPGGQLGRNLLVSVADAMHPIDEVAVLSYNSSLQDVITAITSKGMGAAAVTASDDTLQGLITDGDIRRVLLRPDFAELRAGDFMTKQPIVIAPTAKLQEALDLMEKRKSQLSVLPVVSGEGVFLGLIRIHDIYQAR